jgi:hypothetical protein
MSQFECPRSSGPRIITLRRVVAFPAGLRLWQPRAVSVVGGREAGLRHGDVAASPFVFGMVYGFVAGGPGKFEHRSAIAHHGCAYPSACTGAGQYRDGQA